MYKRQGPTGPAGAGLTLPFSATAPGGLFPLFKIESTGAFAPAGEFRTHDGTAVYAYRTQGSGPALHASHQGDGSAAKFSGGGDAPTVYVQTGGKQGVTIETTSGSSPALWCRSYDPQSPVAVFRGEVELCKDWTPGKDPGVPMVNVSPDDGDGASALRLYEPGFWGFPVTRIELDADDEGRGARVDLHNSSDDATIKLQAEESPGSGPELQLTHPNGNAAITLDADHGGAPRLYLTKSDGSTTLILDADESGKSRVVTDVLEITGGADLVEGFDAGSERCEPGTVVVLDPARPGKVTASSAAYDRRVVGVVSGAGGVDAGLRMGQAGALSGDTPVALTGRVYVRCTAANGPVEPGDLLTTAELAGHAMKATDPGRSFGAVIGKALSSLDEGTGLVLVLVNLQ